MATNSWPTTTLHLSAPLTLSCAHLAPQVSNFTAPSQIPCPPHPLSVSSHATSPRKPFLSPIRSGLLSHSVPLYDPYISAQLPETGWTCLSSHSYPHSRASFTCVFPESTQVEMHYSQCKLETPPPPHSSIATVLHLCGTTPLGVK